MSEGQGNGQTAEAHASDVSPDKTLKYRVKFTGTDPQERTGKGALPYFKSHAFAWAYLFGRLNQPARKA